MAYGLWEGEDGSLSLADDGTLDTVFEYTCAHCDQSEDVRYSDVDREDDGRIDHDWIIQALRDLADDHAMACPVED